jgi:hypothetical protein
MVARPGAWDTVPKVIPPRHLQLLRSGRTSSPRRGATLLVTVLLGLVAASITLVIVKTSLDNARSNASRRAYDVAYAAAKSTAEETARRLSADPLVLLREVGPDEPGRVCDAVLVDDEPLVVASGQAWPQECGSAWYYETNENSTRVWVRPPTGTDPGLLVRAVVDVAGTRAGVQLRMLPGRSSAVTLSSESSLNLALLRRGGGTVQTDGLVHGLGLVTVPGSGVDFGAAAVMASEVGFSGTRDEDVRWYGPTGGAEDIRDIRQVLDVPLTVGMLRARHMELRQAACRGGAMRATAAGPTDLCLTAGRSLVNSSGDIVTAPATIGSWLLLPGRGGNGTVDVFYRIVSGDEALTCPSGQPACSLPQLAASTPQHPSRLSTWTLLGRFDLPSGSLVATDTTTHLGLCGDAGIGLAAACTTYGSGTDPGVTSERGFTVVVGTVSDPADLYLSGPVNEGAGRIGMFVSGDVLVPYWSHAVSGALIVEADLAVLGRSSADPLRSLPTDAPANADNVGSTLDLRGALALTRGTLDLDGFSVLNTALQRPAAPWWSATTGWHSVSLRRTTAAELAGSTGAASMWTVSG